MLIAPSEPRSIKILGTSSTVPETYGADILFPANGGMVGVQRKELSDLIASVQDGRLTKELAQMQRLGLAVLIVEGRPKWSTDGALLRDYGMQWTRSTHRNLLYSVQARGVWVEQTDDANDTVGAVLNLHEYLRKPKHHSLIRRPGPKSPWGKAGNRDWLCHFLQGLEGVGPELAERIVDYFGGRSPIAWQCTAEHLKGIEGIGPKRAKALMDALS